MQGSILVKRYFTQLESSVFIFFLNFYEICIQYVLDQDTLAIHSKNISFVFMRFSSVSTDDLLCALYDE